MIKEEQLDMFLVAQKDKSEDLKTDSFSDFVVYVDESGDASMKVDPHYPMFVLAFCVFYKDHYSDKVVPALEKFKFKYFGHDQVVLHEHEIRKQTGQFSILTNLELRQRFIVDLSNIIDSSNFILISCAVDKGRVSKRITEGRNIYHVALDFCLQKLYEFMQEKGQQQRTTHVVVEMRGPKEDEQLREEFERICGGNNPTKSQLPFEVIFSDKKAMSSGLQLADLVARPVGLNIYRPTQRNQTYHVLSNKFYCKDGRENIGKRDKFFNYGLMVFPSLKSKQPR